MKALLIAAALVVAAPAAATDWDFVERMTESQTRYQPIEPPRPIEVPSGPSRLLNDYQRQQSTFDYQYRQERDRNFDSIQQHIDAESVQRSIDNRRR